MLRTVVAATVGLSSIAVAHATPMTFQHTGRLLDAQGSAINDDVTLTVELSATNGGAAFWTQSFAEVPVEGGYFTVEVGGGATALTAADLERPEVWLTTTYPGGTATPHRLLAVPYAVHAATASNVNSQGSVVQMVTVQTRTQGTYSVPASGTGAAITPLDLVITPKKAGNQVLLEWTVNGELHYNTVWVVTRNGTMLAQATNGANNRWAGAAPSVYDANDQNSTPSTYNVRIVDMNSLATATTYQVHARGSNSAYTFYLNRTVGTPNRDGYEATLSVGTATEIWQD